MANHSDNEDFRGQKKQARILGYDAEAWIKAKREEREQFKAVEGTDMEGLDKLARDPHMDAVQKGHQERQAAVEKTHEKSEEDKGKTAGQFEHNEKEKQLVDGNQEGQAQRRSM